MGTEASLDSKTFFPQSADVECIHDLGACSQKALRRYIRQWIKMAQRVSQ
jgi:hypothetical protein